MNPSIDASLTAWLGPWRLKVAKGNALETHFYSQEAHHLAMFDWLAHQESGAEILREHFGTVWTKAKGFHPVAVASLTPLATPFESGVQYEGMLLRASNGAIAWLARDALTSQPVALSDSLEKLGLTRANQPDLAAATAAKDGANRHLQKGDLEAARSGYREAIMLCPSYFAAYTNLGRSYSMGDDHRTADALFRFAIRVAPDQINPMMCLAALLTAMGRSDEARDWLLHAKVVGAKTPADDADLKARLKKLKK